MSPVADTVKLIDRPGPPAAAVRRVFQAQQTGDAQVLVVGPDAAFEVFDIQHAVLAANRASRHAAHRGRGSSFEVGDIVAGLAMRADSHLVRLCSRAGVDRGFLVEHLADCRLESVDCRVFGAHVVTDLGLHNRLQHSWRGLRDGVAVHVDQGVAHEDRSGNNV